jgi:hypothetical protein
MFAGSALVAAMAWWGCRSTRNVRVRAKLFRLLDDALFFFVVIAASGLAAQVIKHVVGRARPKVGPSAFSFHPLSLDNGFASLPSGHATSAFAAATALGLMVARGRGALVVLAAAVGASRVGSAGALSERRRHRCGTRGDGRFGVEQGAAVVRHDSESSRSVGQTLRSRPVPRTAGVPRTARAVCSRLAPGLGSPPLPVPPAVPSGFDRRSVRDRGPAGRPLRQRDD